MEIKPHLWNAFKENLYALPTTFRSRKSVTHEAEAILIVRDKIKTENIWLKKYYGSL
jgi:hypothetical protein